MRHRVIYSLKESVQCGKGFTEQNGLVGGIYECDKYLPVMGMPLVSVAVTPPGPVTGTAIVAGVPGTISKMVYTSKIF